MRHSKSDIIPVLLALIILLTGCSTLVQDEFTYREPHVDSSMPILATDAATAENYLSLKNAILNLVRTGQSEGVIHVTNYSGALEEDLAQAAYEVSKLDPLGAYAVDYMTHNCAQIVSYYEIRINITFRRSSREIAEIQPAHTMAALENLLHQALESGDQRLTMRLSSFRDQDREIPLVVSDYCAEHVETIMEKPETTVSVYPETGSIRILEVDFQYTDTPEVRKEKQKAVKESLDAAAEYIRYQNGDYEKAQLLYFFLTRRFAYREAETATPLYSAMCDAVADPEGLAQAWQLICDRAGMECYTVTGMLKNAPHTWNIVKVGSVYRHLDMARCVLEMGQLVLWDDGEMAAYYWDQEGLPACVPVEQEEQPAAEQDPADTETTEETEETEAELPAEDLSAEDLSAEESERQPPS